MKGITAGLSGTARSSTPLRSGCKKLLFFPVIVLIAALLIFATSEDSEAKSKPGYFKLHRDYGDHALSDLELLGKYVFFDKISVPPRMACVTCHEPTTGGTGTDSDVNLHQVAITGANPHTVGSLKPPTNAYATFIEPLHPCNTGGLGRRNVCGGNFWDGRAEGNLDPMFPDGATKHIGDEIFYTTDGMDLEVIREGVREYALYFGPVADQALNPMPNPVEQNIPRQAVCEHVKEENYGELYERVWGVEIDCSDDPVLYQASDVEEEKAFDISFKRLMLAVTAWQASEDLNSFSSRRDIALRAELACACENPENAEYPGDEVCEEIPKRNNPLVCIHPDYQNSPGDFPLVGLSDEENLGHDLFYGIASELNFDGKNANCGTCHSDNPPAPGPAGGVGDTGAELLQLYAADDYHNIGTPPNPEIPLTFNSDGIPIDPDLGLAGHAGSDYPPGFFKTPTLRNVDKRKDAEFVKAYTHNGWFKSLESLVHFYNTAAMQEDLDRLPPFFPPELREKKHDVTRCAPEITTEADALANNCWPAPAYGGGAIPFLLGNLGLTEEEEAAIVAYMKTLTDYHTARAPKPYKKSKHHKSPGPFVRFR